MEKEDEASIREMNITLCMVVVHPFVHSLTRVDKNATRDKWKQPLLV